ncbi:MAG: hypothetical protein PGN11_02610 [Quadrisphaera sp.]
MAVLLLAGCGRETSPAVTGGGQPGAGAGTTVDCGGSVYDVEDLADAPAASSLPEGPAGAVNDLGEPAFDPALSWSVVRQGDDRADLVRELDEPVDQGGGDIRTHESVTLERITGASNVADGTWLRMSAGSCAQRLLRDDGLVPANITLASDSVLAERTLELLVRERECASGQNAEGRIEAEVEETAEQVLLRVAVRPLPGGQSCPSSPATSFTVELTEPLGDREVVDASVVPARPVAVTASE